MNNRIPLILGLLLAVTGGVLVFTLQSPAPTNSQYDLSYTKTISLPDWVDDFMDKHQDIDFSSPENRMQFTIDLSRWNVEHETGGPFGAAVFDIEAYKLVGIGVNRVVPESFSPGHAEVMAITMAQEKLQNFDLGDAQYPKMELVTSSQPCAMCTGAILWSGVKSVLYGASGADVERLTGFDEGPVHPDWILEFESRGISVKGKILSKEANDVLSQYAEKGVIYNSRAGDSE